MQSRSQCMSLTALQLNPAKGPNMRSLVLIVTPLLVTVAAANAGEIVIKPKSSDGAVVLRIGAGKIVEASDQAAAAGEIVIKPKASDSAVVLTLSAGKLVKAGVRSIPEHVAEPVPVKDTALLQRTPP